MPCLRKNYELNKAMRHGTSSHGNSSDNKHQKSTTDSDEQAQGRDNEVVQEAAQAVPAKWVREPKIKPNYGTKAGGMLLKT